MTEEERERKNKRASMFLALLLAILAVILTIIALGPETRVPETAPPERTPTPTLSTSAPPSPGATSTSGSIPGGSGGAGGGGSGIVQCPAGGNIACPKSFTIAGDAGGLYPGGTVQLGLTLSNPNSHDIRVTSVTVSVTGTSASSCSTSYLQTSDYSGLGVTVPGNGSSTLSLPITLARSAPDACQNVTFTLAYAGKAEEA